MIITFIISIVILLIIGFLFYISYIKAPPNMAYIISGWQKEPRILIGKAGFKCPFFERLDKLDLGLFQSDIKLTSPISTADFINIKLDGTANLQIKKSNDSIQLAAQHFLNLDKQRISNQINDILESSLREIISVTKLVDILNNRKAFNEKIHINAKPKLEKLGLELISFNSQNFTDDNGVINDLGIDNIEQIKKYAAIAKSNSQKEILIQQAENKRISNAAQIAAATQIAEQNTALEIKTSELKSKSEIEKAIADTAYNIQKADQNKLYDLAITNGLIAKSEREIELKNQEITLKEKELDALVRKKADADLYASQKAAEALAYEEIKKAETRKIIAEINRYIAEQEAAGITAKYNAEAEGIRVKSLAEAEGIDKKVEAQCKMGKASILEMYYNMLPKAIAAASSPLSNVDKITLSGDEAQTKLISNTLDTLMQIIKITQSANNEINNSQVD